MNIDLSLIGDKIVMMVNGFFLLLPNILIAIVVFLLFWMLGGTAKSITARILNRKDRSQNVSIVLGRLARGVVILAGFMVALTIVVPSVDLETLIGVLGIGSVAIGFAFKDIFENFLAGVLLLLNEPFKIGDTIIAGGYEGTVETIQTRATFIKTYDGRRVVMPNATLFTSSVTVNTAFEARRTDFTVGIGYDDDVELAKKLILEAIHEVDGVLPDPAPDVMLTEFADSSVNLWTRWWTHPTRTNLLVVRDNIIDGIKKKFDAHGVGIPFPIRTVFFTDETPTRKAIPEQSDGQSS